MKKIDIYLDNIVKSCVDLKYQKYNSSKRIILNSILENTKKAIKELDKEDFNLDGEDK